MKLKTYIPKADDATFIRDKLDKRPIVLVGLMGAGKSSLGKRLALSLEIPFLDADAEIEAAAGMDIPDIFALHGEKIFRDGERRVIARLLKQEKCVLATGGGAFMNEETRALIKEVAMSVWLKVELDVLMRRVRRRTNRPLLQNNDPEGVMRKFMEVRHPVYAEAHLTVETGDVPHEEAVKQVVLSLKQYLMDEKTCQTPNS